MPSVLTCLASSGYISNRKLLGQCCQALPRCYPCHCCPGCPVRRRGPQAAALFPPLSTILFSVMDSTSQKTDLCRVVETVDMTRAFRRKSCNSAPEVQFQFEKTKLIISVAGSVLQDLESALLITWIFNKQANIQLQRRLKTC